jgi:putative MATE family efflux protein
MAKHTMDLTTGSVTKKLLIFTMPILASNLLQQFYNAADTVVVGKFASDTALAAVGSTGSLTALILSLFIGLTAGTNVACANHYGARNREKLRKCMHTSILLGVICGIGLAIVGFALARPLQFMMGSPDNVIDQATLYVRIYFCGVPASLIYNFAAAILRAHGDTKRPMIILALSGVVNVLLNLLFVIVFHMDVAGVALATIISQYLSMVAVLYLLYDPKGECAMQKSEMQLDKAAILEVVRIGVPSGVNSALFSLSNVIVQSTINSFGDIIMAGNAASGSIGGFVC